MLARILNNIFAAMMQFYLVIVLEIVPYEETTKTTPPALAVFPMVCFLTSCISSMCIGPVTKTIGRRATFTIGGLCCALGSFILYFLLFPYNSYLMYPTVIIMGIG